MLAKFGDYTPRDSFLGTLKIDKFKRQPFKDSLKPIGGMNSTITEGFSIDNNLIMPLVDGN